MGIGVRWSPGDDEALAHLASARGRMGGVQGVAVVQRDVAGAGLDGHGAFGIVVGVPPHRDRVGRGAGQHPEAAAFGIVFGIALVVASREVGRTMNRRLLWVLGLTSALYAILDIKFYVLDRAWLQSDARMLAELTGVPTVVWGILWIGLALGVVGLVIRRAFARP